MTRDSLRRLILEYEFDPKTIKLMGQTSHPKGGAVGVKALVPRYVASMNLPEGTTVLDFGDGGMPHSQKLRDMGLDVSVYDTHIPRDTDSSVLSQQYDVVYASNVLCVLRRGEPKDKDKDREALVDVITQIYDLTKSGGMAVMNYPLDPRYPQWNEDEVEQMIADLFSSVTRASGYGSKRTPVFVAKK